jgi:hypothetical protein
MPAGAISTAVVSLGSKAKSRPTTHWLSPMVGSFFIAELTTGRYKRLTWNNRAVLCHQRWPRQPSPQQPKADVPECRPNNLDLVPKGRIRQQPRPCQRRCQRQHLCE